MKGLGIKSAGIEDKRHEVAEKMKVRYNKSSKQTKQSYSSVYKEFNAVVHTTNRSR